MDLAQAQSVLANAKALIESNAMDERAKGIHDQRTEEGLALIFTLEIILADARDAPPELQEMLISKIILGLGDLDPMAGVVQH